jgi:hypothetical protein
MTFHIKFSTLYAVLFSNGPVWPLAFAHVSRVPGVSVFVLCLKPFGMLSKECASVLHLFPCVEPKKGARGGSPSRLSFSMQIQAAADKTLMPDEQQIAPSFLHLISTVVVFSPA